MVNLKKIIIPAALVMTIIFGLSELFGEDPYIQLKGIPEKLSFPVKKGTNIIITAAVTGAKTKTVWLAKSKDSNLRILLKKSGPEEYQINLAEPEVSAVLQKASGEKTFRIFAEMEDGKIIESILINYTTSSSDSSSFSSPKCFIITNEKDAAKIEVSSWMDWVNVDKVTKIEIHLGEGNDSNNNFEVKATISDKSWRYEPSGDNIIEIEVTPELRKSWKESGELRLEQLNVKYWGWAVTIKEKPDNIEMKGNITSFIVYQHRCGSIPGTNDYLLVRLDDITGGQVLLSIENANYKSIIDKTAVKAGDVLEFTFGENKYKLFVKQLVNVLIGDDWSEIEVFQLDANERTMIFHLLKEIEESDMTFIREGKEYTAREAAAHLRGKFEKEISGVNSLDEFIEKIASSSSTTGNPYYVKLKDGTKLTSAEWLKKKAENIKKKE
ncbi:MAG: DUF5329 family protein [Planctomycetota bacterium]